MVNNSKVVIPMKIGIQKILKYKWIFLWIFLFTNNSLAQEIIDTNIIGEQKNYKIKKGDNLFVIARVNHLSVAEMMLANPQINNPAIIYVGKNLILPTSHIIPNTLKKGIVINLAESRLYYFPTDSEQVFSVPIAVGAEGSDTPTGKTEIVRKRENPSWTPPERLRLENPNLPKVIPAGPSNPLGKYAMDLSWPRFLIHGTNDPRSIGNKESHGCIRLYPEDIESLFALVEIGTEVRIVDQPIKIGWLGNKIYIESHLPREQTKDIDNTKKIICSKVKNCDAKINWTKVEEVIGKNNGMPIEVGKN
jgi:L,D-transpeptidase ErfK/SrfK